ncbi:MAG: DNA polymerase IV [Rhizobiaceae bacterium]|jgi:DNA polymerase-4|nr:DNA polymerase IV [Rhizobiaceae bacterium]
MGATAPLSFRPFCRDCLGFSTDNATRCATCGSPRLLAHAERDALSIAHIDCDAFYAAVEKRDNPELRDKPVIIGGGKRGVVSTACYIARIHGVKSAMPMFKALAACPQAVVIKPDMAKYARVGRDVRALMLDLTPLVEPVSIDEAFLDLTGTQLLHQASPAIALARMAKRIETEIGISVSVGLSYCKFLAKLASDLDKPRGFSIIGRAESVARLAPMPVRKIWGVGPALDAALEKDGIRTIGQLQEMDLSSLMRRHGAMGQRLYHLARGEDDRKVATGHDTKSVSAETTFNDDLGTRDDLVPPLRALAEEVSARLKTQALSGRTVTLKLKTRDFKSRTRALSLADPTQLADRIFRAGLALLEREIDGTLFRLVGIGVSDLEDDARADPADLVDITAAKRAKAELAVDALRGKFGGKAVETGYTFGRGKRGQ